jgi:lysyl-tRNA synthetase, class II
MSELLELRRRKLQQWAIIQQNVYPGKFAKSHHSKQCLELADGINVSYAGRLVSLRVMGKICFGHVRDHLGKVQISLDAATLSIEVFKNFCSLLDIGDIIGIEGEMWTTQKGEKSIRVRSIVLLSKSLRPLPEKWHGLDDAEMRSRRRYLDLLANQESWDRFDRRNRIISTLRQYLLSNEFMEVETPILQSASSGASARPFVTHHNALDIPLYLRIAPETYLKRLMVAGYERVFEIGKSFRNEGIDSSHLQEFTMLEWYAAYWDFQDNMIFIQELIQLLVKEGNNGSLLVNYQGVEINFAGKWPIVTYRDLVLKDTGIDLNSITDIGSLKAAIKTAGLAFDPEPFVGLGGLIDALYKRFSRPSLIQPMFLIGHPESVVPLARRSDADGRYLDMFQVLVNSWEIVKAYSELIDPQEQERRLLEQSALRDAGDDEAMMMEDDFILAMEYGMPPMSGLGLGVDRLIALITNAKNIRDVIYFPSMRPEAPQAVTSSEGPVFL